MLQVRFPYLILLIISNTLAFTSYGQETASDLEKDMTKKSFLQEMSSVEVVEARLETDFKNLLEKKRFEEYQPAKFIYKNKNGEQVSMAVNIRTRGRFRKMRCGIPPIKLKFDKDELEDNGLKKKFNEVKLVSHCDTSDMDQGETYVMKEFLTYKLYNEITPYSYQVKLLNITYVDSTDNFDFGTYRGFFIEDNEELEHRFEGKVVEKYNINYEEMDHETLHRMVLFQYMIGNTDWKTKTLHNIKYLQNRDSTLLYPLTYDFDFSGVVNAHYAIPNPDYKLTSMRERYFLADSVLAEIILKETVPFFKAREDRILDLIKNFDGISKRERRDVLSYIKSFFKLISDEKSARMAFLNIKED